MSEVVNRNSPTVGAGQLAELDDALLALQQSGAAQFDPVRLHFLQRLAGRAKDQPSAVQQVIAAKLTRALAVFEARLAKVQEDANAAASNAAITAAAPRPEFAAAAAAAPLSNLVRELTQRSLLRENGGCEQSLQMATGLHPESNATQYFRATWLQLSVNKRVTQALKQAPKNAGPINSHNLVLRSLALMRGISPEYLQHFTSYVDTLMCLDHHEKSNTLPAKPVAAAGRSTKPKSKPKPRIARSR